MVEECSLLESKPASTPMETSFTSSNADKRKRLPNNSAELLDFSLLYIATVFKPDIALAIRIFSQRVKKSTKLDWEAVKLLCYLAYTINKTLRLSSTEKSSLICYVDANLIGDKADRKSTSGYVLCLGERILAQSSRKKTSVATSSTKAEYVAASQARIYFRFNNC